MEEWFQQRISEKVGVKGQSWGNWIFGLEFKDLVENTDLRNTL